MYQKIFLEIQSIESVKKLNILEERLISLRQAFAQIYKLHNYGQYGSTVFSVFGSMVVQFKCRVYDPPTVEPPPPTNGEASAPSGSLSRSM